MCVHASCDPAPFSLPSLSSLDKVESYFSQYGVVTGVEIKRDQQEEGQPVKSSGHRSVSEEGERGGAWRWQLQC